MKRFLVILVSLLFASTALAGTSLSRVERPHVLSDGTLELSTDVGPMVDSDDNFNKDKMSLVLNGTYSVTNTLSVSALELTLPFKAAGEYLVALAPEAVYSLGNHSGVDVALQASTLLTEFGGADGARDDLSENLKEWVFGGLVYYGLWDATRLSGELDLLFADIGDTDTYLVDLTAGLDWSLLKRLSIEPSITGHFLTEDDTKYSGELPLYVTLHREMDIGIIGMAGDVTNIGDTYSAGVALLVRNQ